jgi:hypothetical protein
LLHVPVNFLHDLCKLAGRAVLTHHVFATHPLLSRNALLSRVSRLIDVAGLLRVLRVLLPRLDLLLLRLLVLSVGWVAAESRAPLRSLLVSSLCVDSSRSLKLLELIQKASVILNHLCRELLDVGIVRTLLGQLAHFDLVFVGLD